MKTFDEIINETRSDKSFVCKIGKYFNDVWSKETGTKREYSKIGSPTKSFGFVIGNKHFSFTNSKHMLNSVGKVVYKAVDEDNNHSFVFVDTDGNVYADDVKSANALSKMIK